MMTMVIFLVIFGKSAQYTITMTGEFTCSETSDRQTDKKHLKLMSDDRDHLIMLEIPMIRSGRLIIHFEFMIHYFLFFSHNALSDFSRKIWGKDDNKKTANLSSKSWIMSDG